MEELKKKNNSEYTFVKWENVEEIIEMLKKIRKEKLGFQNIKDIRKEDFYEKKSNSRKLENEYASR